MARRRRAATIRVRPNRIERFIGRLLPSVGMRMAINRSIGVHALGLRDGFDVTAAGTRTHRRFGGRGGAADDHQPDRTLWELREQCRHHDRNSALLSGILSMACAQIVGDSFVFKPGSTDTDWNKLASDYIRTRMEAAAFDQRGELDFIEATQTLLRSIWTDGDVLAVETRPDGAMQMFEAHELATPLDRRNSDGKSLRIVNGVGLNAKNQAVAYYVRKRSARSYNGYVPALSGTDRIPAADCLFPAFRKRFGQTRGIPYCASVLSAFDGLDDYLDSETVAARAQSKWGVAITLPHDADETEMPGVSQRTDPQEDSESISTFDRVMHMEAGTVFAGAPGESIDMLSITRPGVTFEPFITLMCRVVGVGVGMPLEYILLDFSKSSWSSARASGQLAQRNFRWWQRFLTNHWCAPWYVRQIRRGIARGDIEPAPDGRHYAVSVAYPRWPWVDPVKEAQAFEVLLDNHLTSISAIIRSMGEDPEEVLQEASNDLQRMRELGLERKRPEGIPQNTSNSEDAA